MEGCRHTKLEPSVSNAPHSIASLSECGGFFNETGTFEAGERIIIS
jgi:hypothetical protein